jgi:hypothetical protein
MGDAAIPRGRALDFNTRVRRAVERTRVLGLRLTRRSQTGRSGKPRSHCSKITAAGSATTQAGATASPTPCPSASPPISPCDARHGYDFGRRAGSPWTDAIIGRLEYGLASRTPKGRETRPPLRRAAKDAQPRTSRLSRNRHGGLPWRTSIPTRAQSVCADAYH